MTWPGPQTDVLKVFVEPTTDDWGTEVYNGDIVIFRAMDSRGEPTGEIAGLEIVGFLDFDRWDALPKLDVLWQLPGQEPLPLEELLKRAQRRLRAQAEQAERVA